LKDNLAIYDARIENYKSTANVLVQGHIDEAWDIVEDAQIVITDHKDAEFKRFQRTAKSWVDAFEETVTIKLNYLREFRAAAEAAANSAAEGFKKEIIYSMHVIRYAGG
jgi:hypothetical protein